ncbi:MAG: PQQ-binding-like beta-propeller repeat protein, partial [Planctomycetota bacterium]
RSLLITTNSFDTAALDAKTGERQWRVTLKRRADASPVIAGNDVWVAASDGRLIRLDLKSGKQKWEHEIRGSYYGAPAITEKELFIADDDGVVRCFRGG